MTSNNRFSMKFAILISALGKNLKKINQWLNHEILNEVYEVIIVVQKSKGFESDVEILKKIGCSIIIDEKLGLSRSRNLAIKFCKSDFFWILDDDIYTDLGMIKIIKNSIKSKSSDIYTFRISKGIDKGLYKNYSNKVKINRINILKISSIEIVVSKRIVDKFSIKFNENFGLGSQYPGCEENLFLLDCFDVGANMIHVPEVVVFHDNLSTGYSDMNYKALIAKGYICKKFGIIGIILLFRWYFRFLIKYRNLFLIKYLIKGYKLRLD